MSQLSRRDYARLLATLAAAAPLTPGAQAQDSPPAQRISKDMLHAALQLLGLSFTDAHEAMMLPGINRALSQYEALRKLHVPLDTEPAFRFSPAPAGKQLRTGPAKFSPTRSARRKTGSWNSLEDLAFAPVTELAALLKSRAVSSVDLTRMYLARLKRYSPKLLCVITLTEDLAITQAERADREIRAGHYRGPLHGIPYGAKDLFATKGIRTTWGAEPFQNQVPDHDATVIENLERAGAVLVAKLSMGALAQGGLWFAGMTKTPWNIEQTSSGSSAGSGSATAAGLVGFSIGTETLGSIVSPSTRCGVTGLRPTYGRVSRFGAMGLSWTMDKIGPICRTVEDCMLVLRAIHGPDGHDLTVPDVPLDWTPAVPVETLRIGYLKTEFDKQKENQKALYDTALDVLRKQGAKLTAVELPDYPLGALRMILIAEAAAAFDDLTRDGGVNQLRGQAAGDWPNTFRSSRLIPAVEYIRAQRARTLLMRDMEKLMADWDVIVTPTFGGSLTLTNLTGHPQIAVPCGFIDGLPQSILFMGRLYEEGTPARVALAYEQATEWHKMHPKMEWSSS